MVVNVSIDVPRRAVRRAQAALDRLIRAGALVVAAAGNHSVVEWPANAAARARGRAVDDGAGAAGKQPRHRRSRRAHAAADVTTFGNVVDERQRHVVRLADRRGRRGAGLGPARRSTIRRPSSTCSARTPRPISRTGRYGSGRVNINAALRGGTAKLPVDPGVGAERHGSRPRSGRRGASGPASCSGLVTHERRQVRLLAPDRPEQVPEERPRLRGVVGGLHPARARRRVRPVKAKAKSHSGSTPSPSRVADRR